MARVAIYSSDKGGKRQHGTSSGSTAQDALEAPLVELWGMNLRLPVMSADDGLLPGGLKFSRGIFIAATATPAGNAAPIQTPIAVRIGIV